MQKIFRKYPSKFSYENCLYEVVEILDLAADAEAKAAAVWIIGEFAEDIPKCVSLIQERVNTFAEEERIV